jgi:hypothetical protein
MTERVDILFRGPTSALHHRWRVGETWYPENPEGSQCSDPGMIMEDTVVVAWGPERFFVFIISPSGDLMYNVYTRSLDDTNGGSWGTRFESLGGSWPHKPSAVSQYPHFIAVSLVGHNRRLHVLRFIGATERWEIKRVFDGTLAQTPAMASNGAHNFKMWTTSVDGTVSGTHWNGPNESQWTQNGTFRHHNEGGQFTNGIKIVTRCADVGVDLLGVGEEGQLFWKFFDGTPSSSWTCVGLSCVGIPEALPLSTAQFDVYFIGENFIYSIEQIF